jgi:hypothetical protein
MSENISPVYEPQGAFRIWKKSEIFTGPDGTGPYVPKVDDLAVEFVSNVVNWYRVSDLNIGTYLSTLVPIAPVPENYLTGDQIALGVNAGATNPTHFIYINKRTVPYSMAVDGRRQIYGSAPAFCKVFAGTDTSGVGRVISAVYDSGGNYVGENVPLELIATDALNNNVAIKVVQPCKTSANLVDGEVVTVVYYSSSGDVIGLEQMKVVNTAFVRTANAGNKTVVGLSLINPFLSTINSKTIVYPRNLTLAPENLTGVVHYSDGSTLHLTVDGERFSVIGLDAYDATATGVSFPLVVKYELSVNEQAYEGVGGEGHVSENYTITTAAVNREYEVRLFPYPKWIDTNTGYGLTWWLYDASRSLGLDVSNLVELAPESASFSPKAYGVKQTLKARINLSNVAGNYSEFTHVQDVDIRLQAPGTFRQDLSTPPNWYVAPISGTTPMCGGGVFSAFTVVSGSTKSFNLKGNFNTLQDWLHAYYELAQPLLLTPTETELPEPTNFVLVVNGAEFPYPIASWNQLLVINVSAANNDTVYIRFQYAGQQMLELGVVGMPLYQRNEDGSYV